MTENKVYSIIFTAMFLTITVVSKQVLAGIPNIQLVTLLMAVYFSNFSIKSSVTFVFSYVIIDYLIWGFFTLIFPAAFAWMSWAFMVKMSKSYKSIVLLTVPFTIVHAAAYLFHDLIFMDLPLEGVISYIAYGLPYNIAFLISSMFTILWLYNPVNKLVKSAGEMRW